MAKPLTPRQRQIFRFIKDYSKKNGYSPTYLDIGKAVGLTSSATIYNHIKTLEKKGYIKRMRGVSRGIEILIDKEPTDTELIFVSVLGKITGNSALEENGDEVSLTVPKQYLADSDLKSCFALKVKGSGLISEGCLNNDYILLSYSEKAINNETALIQLDNNVATIRKIQNAPEGIKLVSATNSLQNLVVVNPKIHGKVLGVFRFFPL